MFPVNERMKIVHCRIAIISMHVNCSSRKLVSFGTGYSERRQKRPASQKILELIKRLFLRAAFRHWLNNHPVSVFEFAKCR